jgi:SagB-type dehydrogenase family enzyme
MDKKKIAAHRAFLQDTLRLKIDFRYTDQSLGKEPPAIQKPPSTSQKLILLPDDETFRAFRGTDLIDAIGHRRSHRHFQLLPLSIDEISFLLWATQGVCEVFSHGSALRTVPSAGCRHAFETYLVVNNVETLENGVYRYLPLEHALVFEHELESQKTLLAEATLGQAFTATAPVTFVWTVLPYRMEWRYDLAAHRVIAMDVGHVCQNLYLACESIRAGTCAVAAYDQEKMDALLKVDGEDEFTIYLAPVGKL